MSDRTYKGVVSKLYEREWQDRDSGEDIILHSFQIESEKRYFRTGTKKPTFNEGDAISFVSDGKGNVKLTSVQEIDAGEAPPKPAGNAGGKRASAGASRDNYWADKAKRDQEVTEPRISYSAAQKNATALVAAALAADALSFGQTSKGKKLDMLVDYVEQVTTRLAALQMNAPAILEEYANDE